MRTSILSIFAVTFALAVCVDNAHARGGGGGGGGFSGGGRGGFSGGGGSIRYSGGGARPSAPVARPSTPSAQPRPSNPSSWQTPNTGMAQRPDNYGSLFNKPTQPIEKPIGGSGSYKTFDGPNGGKGVAWETPRGNTGVAVKGGGGGSAIGVKGAGGGEAGAIKGPGGAAAVGVKGAEGGSAAAIRGPGGYWIAGAKGANGGAAVAAKGPYGYGSYVRLPNGSSYYNWHGNPYWRSGGYWYRPYYYAGTVYYSQCGAPYGWDGDDLSVTDSGITTFELNGVTYFYRNGVYYVVQNGKYVVVPNPYEQQPSAPSIDPKASEQLNRLNNALSAIKSFRVVIRDVSDEILDSGQKVQVESRRTLAMRAPDKMAVEFSSDGVTRHTVYDGSKITVYEKASNMYSQTNMPPTISQTMDVLASQYGMAIPAMEMFRPLSVDKLIAQIQTGEYLGPQKVEGDSCQVIRLGLEWADVQVWILDADRALPRRVMISYKKIPSTPKYVMNFTNWDINNPPDSVFALQIPADAAKVEMHPLNKKE